MLDPYITLNLVGMDTPVKVNVFGINYYHAVSSGTAVSTDGGTIFVKESPDKIERLIINAS